MWRFLGYGVRFRFRVEGDLNSDLDSWSRSWDMAWEVDSTGFCRDQG